MSFWDAVRLYGTEDRWYGEALIKSKVIGYIPIKPLFKVYHYEWQYIQDQKKGIDVNELTNNYIGVIYQSNWDKRLDSDYVKKKPLSYISKKIK